MVGMGLGIGLTRRRAGGGGPAPIPANFQSVNADGWSATYASPPTFDPAGSPEEFTVSRAGFDATGTAATITENLICTQRIRQVFPNEGSLTTDQVSLSDYIYSTDTIAGVTNNSTETSPKPVANWARADRTVCGDTLHLEVVGFHRNGVAAVEFRATDGTTTVTQVVSEMTILPAVGDRFAVIGYKCDLDVSTLDDPATLTVNAKVFPRVGGSGSVLDSADQSNLWEFSPRSYRRDTTRFAAPYYVYVASGGNDTTGVVSTVAATASATPCATITGAIRRLDTVNGNIDYGRIRVKAGTHVFGALGSTTVKQSHSELVIERDPVTAFGDVTVTFGVAVAQPNIESLTIGETYLRIANLAMVRNGSNPIRANSIFIDNLRITWENCTLDLQSFVTNPYSSTAITDCIEGLSVTASAGHGFWNINSANPKHRLLRGAFGVGAAIDAWCVMGSQISDPTTLALGFPTSGATGAIIAFNEFRNAGVSPVFLTLAASSDVSQFAMVQNLGEYYRSSAGTAIAISADSATGDTTHVILWHNTVTGFFSSGRNNTFYDDGASARTNKLMSCVGNIWTQINTKGDVFAASGARIGNRAYQYGVGCQGEFSQFIDAENAGIGGSFAQAYPGLRASIGTSNSVRNDPLFVDYEGTTSGPTAGAGGGDYALQSGSPAKARVKPVLPFDLAGNPRSATLASAGAYE